MMKGDAMRRSGELLMILEWIAAFVGVWGGFGAVCVRWRPSKRVCGALLRPAKVLGRSLCFVLEYQNSLIFNKKCRKRYKNQILFSFFSQKNHCWSTRTACRSFQRERSRDQTASSFSRTNIEKQILVLLLWGGGHHFTPSLLSCIRF